MLCLVVKFLYLTACIYILESLKRLITRALDIVVKFNEWTFMNGFFLNWFLSEYWADFGAWYTEDFLFYLVSIFNKSAMLSIYFYKDIKLGITTGAPGNPVDYLKDDIFLGQLKFIKICWKLLELVVWGAN